MRTFLIAATAALCLGYIGVVPASADDCPTRCHAQNPSSCEGNTDATKRCYNACEGYQACPVGPAASATKGKRASK